MEQFEQIVFNITSKDHSVRNFAESSLETLIKHNILMVSTGLLELMEKDLNETSSLAAVLYRRLFIEKKMWEQQDPEAKTKLLRLIQPFRPLSFLKKVADILVSLAVSQDFSTEILSLSTSYLHSDLETLKLLALYILDIGTEHTEIVQVIEKNSCSVFELLWQGLHEKSSEIQKSACKTTCQILVSLKENPEYGKVFNVVLDVIQTIESSQLFCILSAVAQLVEVHPRIVVGLLDKFVMVMGNIGKNTGIDKESRVTAGEVLIQIVHKCTGLVKKSRFFVQEILTLSMIFLAEVEFASDLQAWNEAVESEVTLLDPYGIGRLILSVVSDILQDTIYNDIIVLIEAHLSAPHWIYNHTGIIALGLISEGCVNSLNPSKNKYIQALAHYTLNEHPRIRYAALFSLSLFFTFFTPHLQVNYHSPLIPSILANLDLSILPKLKSQALNSIINFCEGLKFAESNIIEQYLPEIIRQYDLILTDASTPKFVLETLLRSLSVVIGVSGNSAYLFQEFLPKLRKIFYLPGESVDELKTEAIKCIGCILKSNNFEYSDEIIEEILALKQKVCENDTCYSELIEVICKKVVKQGSIPQYFEQIIDELLKNAQTQIDVAVIDTDSGSSSLYQGLVIELRGMGDKKIALNTSAMHTKISACKLISFLLSKLTTKLSPWFSRILQVMQSLLDFNYNPTIRSCSLKSIILLFSSSEKHQAESLVLSIFPVFLKMIDDKIEKFPEDVNKIVKAMGIIGEHIGDLMVIRLQGARTLSELLSRCIKVMIQRKGERLSYKAGITDEGLYTEELKNLEKGENIDEELLRGVVDLVGLLLKTFKSQFKPYFQEYFQGLIGEILYKKEPSEREIVTCICLFCDYIEHINDLLISSDCSLLLEEFLKYSYHRSADVRQCSVYGIGLSALYGGKEFIKYLPRCIEACNYIINIPLAFEQDLIVSSECAVGSLGKIALKYRDDLIPIWLSYLPLKSDPEEAAVASELFFQHFEKIQHFDRAGFVFEALKNRELVTF